MKTLITITIAVLYSHLLPANSKQHTWKLEKDDSAISVYTRPKDGSKVKEFKATTILNVNIDDIVSTLKDADNYIKWIYDCKESKLVEKTNENSFSYYTCIATPWPIDDRDMVVKVSISSDKSKLETIFNMNSTASKIPTKKGTIRIDKLESQWILKKISDNKTKITYWAHSEPGGELPSWLIDLKLVDSPFYTLLNLRKLFEKK